MIVFDFRWLAKEKIQLLLIAIEWYDTECQWYNLEENSTEKEEKVNIRVTIEQPTSI